MPAWLRGSLLLALTFAAGLAVGVGIERRASRERRGGMDRRETAIAYGE